jgi:hypothetical protein
VHLLVKENPKRKGSQAAKDFNKYKNGMTVEQLLAAGVPIGDIRWNQNKKFIRLS